jgi:predicted RNA-binding protein with PUA-like domain
MAKASKPVPGRWLFKEEPSCYGYADLERDGETLWGGVTNNLALIHLRSVRAGDRILYYHTGTEKAVVGEMRAVADAVPDPKAGDPKIVAVKVKPVKRWPTPVTLKAIKADATFADWELVKNSRLSVMPVSAEVWKRLEEMSREGS